MHLTILQNCSSGGCIGVPVRRPRHVTSLAVPKTRVKKCIHICIYSIYIFILVMWFSIYIYRGICVYVYMYICIYVYMYMYMYMYMCMCICTTYIYIYMHINMNTYELYEFDTSYITWLGFPQWWRRRQSIWHNIISPCVQSNPDKAKHLA